MRKIYSAGYFESTKDGSLLSAEEIIPLVRQLREVKTVVDVGCGLGAWLYVWHQAGADILGLDGSWVKPDKLCIPPDKFMALDLEQPFDIGRKFDLVMSLEVAEHLKPSNAGGFVRSLVKLGSLVLFSAAVPGQGGKYHRNEQWPDYWADLFAKENFLPLDYLRPKVWQQDKIEWWYRQNIIIYAQRDAILGNAVLEQALAETRRDQLSLVHPQMAGSIAARYSGQSSSFRQVLSVIKGYLRGRI